MPMMNLFEPLFLLLALVTLGTLVTVAVCAMRGQRARAGRIVRRLGIGAAAYFAVVIAASILEPRRAYRLGDGISVRVESIARNEGKTYQRDFKVITGVDGEVEVLAR